MGIRVTQNMMVRNYLRAYNRNLSYVSKSEQRMLGQKYNKASENISDTSRALRVRQNLFDNEVYTTNIRDANARLEAAENNLTSINEILEKAREQIINKAANDPSASARETLATELDNLKDEMVQFMNAQFSDSYLFGGTENGEPPFAVGEDGRLTYHGFAVDDITFDADQQKYIYTNPETGEQLPVPEDGEQYVDIGMGMTMNGDSVNSNSAFKISFSGLEVFGCGKDENGVSQNIFNMLKDAADILRKEPFDREALENVSVAMKDSREDLTLQISGIGTQTQFLETSLDRLDKENLTLTTLQQKLEVTDTAVESMNWKVYTALLNATYQFSSQVLPNTLMDFIR